MENIEKFKERFKKQEILPFERVKTPEEINIINSISRFMPEFLREYGGEPEELLASENIQEHIHFIDVNKLPDEEKEKLKKRGGKVHGACRYAKGEVKIYSQEENANLLPVANDIVHELIHMNSYNRVTYYTKVDDFDTEKVGFEILSKDRKYFYFTEIQENTTDELKRRFDEKYFSTINELKSDLKERGEIAERDKCAPQDIIFFSEKIKDDLWKSTISREIRPNNFEKMITEIYSKNKKDFVSEEEVFKVFIVAMLSGKLLKMARLIEKTYGKGSFRNLANTSKAEPITNLP